MQSGGNSLIRIVWLTNASQNVCAFQRQPVAQEAALLAFFVDIQYIKRGHACSTVYMIFYLVNFIYSNSSQIISILLNLFQLLTNIKLPSYSEKVLEILIVMNIN